MTAAGTHGALRGLLLVLAILMVVGGLVVTFWTSGFISVIPVQPQFALSALSMVIIKALGLIAVMIGYLAFRASQDPVRYVAVIDALIFLLLALAALDLWATLTQNIGTVYPRHLIWLREAVRIIVAIALIILRPRPGVARE